MAWSGSDPTDPSAYQVTDFQRGPSLPLLGAVFALAVIALGRWQGLAALAALGVTLGPSASSWCRPC